MKTISILGSTGSIGLNSLEIIKKKNYFKIILLSAKKYSFNWKTDKNI